MDSFFTFFLHHYEWYLRVFISAILGFVIGWDRESKNKPAGIKTYMYVCVACTLITLVSIYSAEEFASMNSNIRMDPFRLAAQIVSGLGFLGAGVILKNGMKIKGLTSAAMILFVGGVGIGIGAGFYGLVIFTVFISLILARVGESLEKSKIGVSKDTDDENINHSS